MLRNLVFFAAIIAMNYTLARPSPVDFLFVASLVLSLFVRHRLHAALFVFFILVVMWTAGFYLASIPYFDDPEVRSELQKKTFVVLLSLTAAYVGSSWGDREFHRFYRVYIASCVIGASLGISGFLFNIPDLIWDGRSKGYFDDPNMYGAFLIPGALACMYFSSRGPGRPLPYLIAGAVIILGIVFSFSRAATAGFVVISLVYLSYLHRGQIGRLIAAAAGVLLAIMIMFAAAFALVENFQEKFLERATIAKEYDQGREGRYARYVRSIPIILETPRGLGINQQDHIFWEPIHNIFLSSFLNYGWLGGVAWLLVFIGSLKISLVNYRLTSSPIVPLAIASFVGPVLCALLHEGEHWRHLWLFLGLVWGLNPSNFPARRAAVAPLEARRGRAVPEVVVPLASGPPSWSPAGRPVGSAQ
ncbi:MAG TPA: O-antigen ligase family protein [Afifellaceae bacterium]|nr:O-antigen ligase family protein [Afifellaceae bacterium]